MQPYTRLSPHRKNEGKTSSEILDQIIAKNSPVYKHKHLTVYCWKSDLEDTLKAGINSSSRWRLIDPYFFDPSDLKATLSKIDDGHLCKIDCHYKIAVKVARWGTRGPLGDQPLQYKLVRDCSIEHLAAILETQSLGKDQAEFFASILRMKIEQSPLEPLLVCRVPFIRDYAKAKLNETK